MSSYDVVVIGAGPAGQHCASHLARGGLRVAIVERERVGGECDYYACIPSKTLLRPGEALAAAREAPGAREAAQGRLDPAAAFEWRDFMVSGYDDTAKAQWLADNDIELVRGDGRIAGRGRVEVDGRMLATREIVVATGSDAFVPPIPGIDGLDGVWTNRGATAADEVPRRLIVLGGGPVGVELAQAMHRMGAEVVLVEVRDRVLAGEPEPLGHALGDALRRDGVGLRLGVEAGGVRREGADLVLSLDGGEELRGDRLLVATGRRPRVQGIGLESVGAEVTSSGVTVDGHMRAADGVWAIGDASGIWPLTYVGKYQARVAAANILGTERVANYEAVPRVVFTDPQAAAVGAAEGEVMATVALSAVPRTSTYTRLYAERNDYLTLIGDGERVTGAHALGPDAGEWLQQATLAIRARIPVDVLRDTIQPFPTFSEVFLDAFAQLGAPVPD